MSLDIQRNELHYYVDLLRMRDSGQHYMDQTKICVKALHNIIRTMKFARHDKICDENFTNLDWGNLPFDCNHFSLNGDFPCDFSGCKLSKWNFLKSPLLSAIVAVSYSHDGKIIGVADCSGNVVLWDSNSGLMIQQFSCLSSPISLTSNAAIISFSHDDCHCMICYDNKSVLQYDITTGKCVRTFATNDEALDAIIRERHDDIYNKSETIQNLKYRSFLRDLPEALICFSPNGRYYVQGSLTGVAKLWNTKTERCIHTFTSFINLSESISFSPDGKYLLVGSYYDDKGIFWRSNSDNTAKLWNIRKGQCVKQLDGYRIYPIAFSVDSLLCMTNYDDGVAKLWNTNSKKCLYTFALPINGHLSPCELSPNGNYVLSYSIVMMEEEAPESEAYLWSIASDKPITLEGMLGGAIAGCFFPNGDKCMLLFNNGLLKVWSIKTAECIKDFRIRIKTCRYLSATVSPDEKYIVLYSTSETWSVILNIETGRCSPLEINSNKLISSVTFAPDGKHFILAFNTEVTLYEMVSDNPILVKSFQSPIDDNYWTEYIYPYWIIRKQSYIELYKRDYFEDSETKQIDLMGRLYMLDGLFVSNCSFTDITADDDARMILFQYGAEIDSLN